MSHVRLGPPPPTPVTFLFYFHPGLQEALNLIFPSHPSQSLLQILVAAHLQNAQGTLHSNQSLTFLCHLVHLWIFLCSCWLGKLGQVAPGLRPFSPLTGPMPGTTAEREVDDTARKGHKKPVTLSVQLQPYDPSCHLGCPLPTAPRVRPEGIRMWQERLPFPLRVLMNRRGGIQAMEDNPWDHPAQHTVRPSHQPLSLPPTQLLPQQSHHWCSRPIPTFPSAISQPNSALQGLPSKGSPGGAVGINLFQYDGLRSPRLPPWGQHLQYCTIIGAKEQDGDVTVRTSHAVHSYLGQ
jgi:hypothetical protein